MSETYETNVECSNCGYKGPATIPKGTKVGNWKCPTCGVKSLCREGGLQCFPVDWGNKRGKQ